MRFGHLFYPMSFDPAQDSRIIDEALEEAQLTEELGLDAIWLTEHHFSGEVAYADPLVFGGAVAVKTRRVLLGFAVVEMALHNPVRLAVQTALLDNLSHGRLLVGIGRGSNFSSYEYAGFGTTVRTGHDSISEAEDLLIKAWTCEDLEFNGKYFKVSIPGMRPKPYQKPHPPIARACISDDTVVEMARIGRPTLLRLRASVEAIGRQLRLYHDTLASAGFSEEKVETILDQTWIWADGYVAEEEERALDEFIPAYERGNQFINDARERWNPWGREGQDVPVAGRLPQRSAYGERPDPTAQELLVGSPKRVAEQMAMLRDHGVRNLMLSHRGVMPRDKALQSLRLFSEQVVPLFR